MRDKPSKTIPTTREEDAFLETLRDVLARSSSEEKAQVTGALLGGTKLDPFKAKLLRAAGDLGVPLPPQHQSTYDDLKAKSAEHGRKVSTGLKNYRRGKAEAEQMAAQQSVPECEPPAVVERSLMEKIGDYAPPEPNDRGAYGMSNPGLAASPKRSSDLPPHPLRPVAPKSTT